MSRTTSRGSPTSCVRRFAGASRDDAGSRALYAADGSNYRAVPDLVVVPADAEDLATAVMLTAAAGAPVTCAAAVRRWPATRSAAWSSTRRGTSTGSSTSTRSARTAVVEPGVVLTDLLAAARPHGLTFGADPSSGSRATLGGMIANNACGAHSVAWGTTADNVRSLDLVLADGTRCTVDADRGSRPSLAARRGAGGRAPPSAAGLRRPARVGDPAAVRAVSAGRSRATRCTGCCRSTPTTSRGCCAAAREVSRRRCRRPLR